MNNLNPNQKLNPKLFDLAVEQMPTRKGFGEGLLAAGEADKNIVGLCADLTESTQMHLFRAKFPERFVEIGVAEQNLATVASGLAAMGKIPFISSYAMFSPGRNWEQIRTTIAYNNRPVKIVGSHTGVSVGPDGGTHQALEDIALMRVVPRIQVVVPCDAIEAKKATLAIAQTGQPAYLRLTREKTPIITTSDSPFTLGQANVLRQPDKPVVALIATGAVVYQALMAAEKLSKESQLEATVINLHTIKPIDTKTIIEAAKLAGAVVTVEEHQIAGGVGSAVAEVLMQNCPVPQEFIGVQDEFGQSGDPNQLLDHYDIDPIAIARAAQKAISRKK